MRTLSRSGNILDQGFAAFGLTPESMIHLRPRKPGFEGFGGDGGFSPNTKLLPREKGLLVFSLAKEPTTALPSAWRGAH